MVGRLYALAAGEVTGAAALCDGGALLPAARPACQLDQGTKSQVAAAPVQQLRVHVLQRRGAHRGVVNAARRAFVQSARQSVPHARPADEEKASRYTSGGWPVFPMHH